MKITDKMVTAKVDLLNRMTGHPARTFEKTDTGWKYNVGTYGVEQSYSCYNLFQTAGESGGQTVLTSGTKADIVAYISAYLRGWGDSREARRA